MASTFLTAGEAATLIVSIIDEASEGDWAVAEALTCALQAGMFGAGNG